MIRTLIVAVLFAALVPTVTAAEELERFVPTSRGGRSASLEAPAQGVLASAQGAVITDRPLLPVFSLPPVAEEPAAPPPAPAPEPVEEVSLDPVERWRPLVASYPGWNVDQALTVIRCESSGNPRAVNRSSGAAGLFQMLGWQWLADRLFGRGASLLDPEVNVAAAHWLWTHAGGFWPDWAASRACWAGR